MNDFWIFAVAGFDPIRQSLDSLKKEVTDKAMEVRETLKRFQGRVFHAVNTTHGYMTRYRYVILKFLMFFLKIIFINYIL